MRHMAGRRTFIRTAGAVSLGGLAGCIDGGDTVANENPTGEQNDTEDENSAAVEDPWRTFQGSAGRRGRADGSSPEDRSLEWTASIGDRIQSGAVIDGNGRVYVVTTDDVLYALSLEDGGTLWQRSLPTTGRTPTIAGGRLFVSADRLYALNRKNGETKWTSNAGGGPAAAPAVHGDSVYVCGTDTSVYRIDRSNGDVRESSAPLDGDDPTMCAVGGDRIVVGDDMGIYCLSLSGSRKWYDRIYAQVSVAPTVAGDQAFAGTASGTMYAMDAESGDQLWDRKLGGAVEMSPAVDAEGVIVAAEKTLYKLRRISGDVMWETELEESSESSPVVTDEAIYFGDNGGRILAHDTDDGTKRWEHETERSVRAPPAMADDALVVGSNYGRLYSLR